ncbi:hypothetical protein Hanom_Chr01g00068931 [Helianthus anomalus]
MDVRFKRIYCNKFALLAGHDSTEALISFRLSTSRMFVGDMEGVYSYVEGICGRDGLVGVVEDDMESVHSSQFLGKNGEE